jgi:integrase/recombinase XerD
MKQAQVLGEKEVKRVLSAISKRSYCNRDRAMFMLSYLAGMRVGEIAVLKVSDVYAESGSVRDHIRLAKSQTKGGEARTVHLNAQVQGELLPYSHTLTRKAHEPLFVSKWGKQMSPNSLVQVFGRFHLQATYGTASNHHAYRLWHRQKLGFHRRHSCVF